MNLLIIRSREMVEFIVCWFILSIPAGIIAGRFIAAGERE
jgi:hypothetical protein